MLFEYHSQRLTEKLVFVTVPGCKNILASSSPANLFRQVFLKKAEFRDFRLRQAEHPKLANFLQKTRA